MALVARVGNANVAGPAYWYFVGHAVDRTAADCAAPLFVALASLLSSVAAEPAVDCRSLTMSGLVDTAHNWADTQSTKLHGQAGLATASRAAAVASAVSHSRTGHVVRSTKLDPVVQFLDMVRYLLLVLEDTSQRLAGRLESSKSSEVVGYD